ncbi:hypothetical protein LINPERHAP2_LOCUS18520 [Linum perenne]
MDRSWMEKRRFSVEYIKGVSSFMNFIQDHFGDDVNIHCPCKSCLNVFQESQEVVLSHLMINGIDVGYTSSKRNWMLTDGSSYASSFWGLIII